MPLRHAFLTLFFVSFAALCVVGVYGYRLLSSEDTLTGVMVNGALLPATVDAESALQEIADAWLDQDVILQVEGVTERHSRRALGARMPIAHAVTRLKRAGHTGRLLEDLAHHRAAKRGEINVRLPRYIDHQALTAHIVALKRVVDRELVPSRYSPLGELTREPREGRTLNARVARQTIADQLLAGELVIPLEVDAIPDNTPPPVFTRTFDHVLSTYTTRFGRYGGRAHNVRLATSRLNGAIIAPYGELSFNTQVGSRYRSDGYRQAPVIENGVMVDGIGGGTCQVASTLHASAFIAGFEMKEYTPHSRPAGYVPMGLDATVVWPQVDLVIQNPFPFPIQIAATTRGRRLTVELLGSRDAPEVKWRRHTLSTSGYEVREIVDPSLAEGERQISQSGIMGYVIRRTRTISQGGLEPIVQRRVIRYPPTDRVVLVGTRTEDRPGEELRADVVAETARPRMEPRAIPIQAARP